MAGVSLDLAINNALGEQTQPGRVRPGSISLKDALDNVEFKEQPKPQEELVSQEPKQTSDLPPSTESLLSSAEKSAFGPVAVGIAQGETFGQTSRLLPGDTGQIQERIEKIKEEAPIRYYLGEGLALVAPGPGNVVFKAGAKGLKFLTGLARGGKEAIGAAKISSEFAARAGGSRAGDFVSTVGEFAGKRSGKIAEAVGGGAAFGAVAGTLGEGTEEVSPGRGAVSAAFGGALGAAIPGVIALPALARRTATKLYNKTKTLLSDETVTAINNIEKFVDIKTRGARAVVAESVSKLVDFGRRASEVLNTEIGESSAKLSTESQAFLHKLNDEIDKISTEMERSLQQGTAEANKQLTRDSVMIADLSEKAFQVKNAQYGNGLEAVKNANKGTRVNIEGAADEFGQAMEDMGFFRRSTQGNVVPNLATANPEDRDGVKALFKLYKLYKGKGASLPFEDALALKKDLAKITPFHGEITFREKGIREAYFNISNKLHSADKLAGTEKALQNLDADYTESRRVIDSVRKHARGAQGPRRLILNAARNIETNTGVSDIQKLNKFAEIFPQETQEQITRAVSNAGRVIELGTVKPQQARAIRTKIVQAFEKGDKISQKELENLSDLTERYDLLGQAEDLVLSRGGIPSNIANALKDPAELELLEQFISKNSPNSRPAFKQLLQNKEKLDILKKELPSSESEWIKSLSSDAQVPTDQKQSLRLLYDLFPKEAQAIEKAANDLKISKAADVIKKQGFGNSLFDWAKRYIAFQTGGPAAVIIAEALTRPVIMTELLYRAERGISKIAASRMAQRMAKVYEGINRLSALKGSEIGKGVNQALGEQNGSAPQQ